MSTVLMKKKESYWEIYAGWYYVEGDNKCVSLLEDPSYYLQVDFMSLSP